jgi:predicted small lipoprotein YifL
MTKRHSATLALSLAVALALTGCGLKGALTLPSQSEEVVIRDAGQAAPATGTPPVPPATGASPTDAAPPAPAATTTAPTATPAAPGTRKVAPQDTRIPPPPLPGGNPGTARGG